MSDSGQASPPPRDRGVLPGHGGVDYLLAVRSWPFLPGVWWVPVVPSSGLDKTLRRQNRAPGLAPAPCRPRVHGHRSVPGTRIGGSHPGRAHWYLGRYRPSVHAVHDTMLAADVARQACVPCRIAIAGDNTIPNAEAGWGVPTWRLVEAPSVGELCQPLCEFCILRARHGRARMSKELLGFWRPVPARSHNPWQ